MTPATGCASGQIEAFTAFLEADGRKSSDVIEVSPGWNRYWKTMCSNYTSVDSGNIPSSSPTRCWSMRNGRLPPRKISMP